MTSLGGPSNPGVDDHLRAGPPQASSSRNTMPDLSTIVPVPSPSSSAAQSPTSSTSSSQLLPIPTPSTNVSQASFTYPDSSDERTSLGPLPADIATADISIAPDGSFVETSSGPAARELKRRYDQHYGVGKDVRSPYAITAFVNQHGKQMFRVGHRDQSAPAASAADVEFTIQRKPANKFPQSHRSRSKRRSRMSVHALPNLFRNSGSTTATTMSFTGPRKLRKTRSIPDMNNPRAQDGESLLTRPHSNSVTSADAPRLPEIDASLNNGGMDLFGQVMDWTTSLESLSASSSHSFEDSDVDISPSVLSVPVTPIIHPFGPGVHFDSPRKPGLDRLRSTRHLREMQSFESGLTARQTECPSKVASTSNTPISPIISELSSQQKELTRSPSAIRLRPPDVVDVESGPDPYMPSSETAIHSRFSTDVFDVIQTYRGVPLIDKLSSQAEETAVIRLSLSEGNIAAPRNDPRFVIWAEVRYDGDDRSVSQDSYSSASSLSGRRSRKGKSPEVSKLKIAPTQEFQKILVAASIERWIAQMTSELNYDELLDFFLTYRTYIGAVDLCHLLICRFHWALQKHNSPSDEMVRRIVRVRTFVAFRYWLLTFFTVDFLPNRELRLLFASWLNALIRDPILEKHSDGLSIVKKLKKIAQDCKKAHTRTSSKAKSRPTSTSVQQEHSSGKQEHLLGEKFAEATKKLHGEEDVGELDLDFIPEDEDVPIYAPNYPPNAHISNIHLGPNLSPPGSNSIAFSSLSILPRPDHNSDPGEEAAVPFVQTSATLPIHHNALSRAFVKTALVKTIGRLGRWKRVLNNRTTPRAPLGSYTHVSAFDLELSVSRDLLKVQGGVEQYLKLIEPQPDNLNVASNPSTVAPTSSAVTAKPEATPVSFQVPEPSPIPAYSLVHVSDGANRSSGEATVLPPSTSTEASPSYIDAGTTSFSSTSTMDDEPAPQTPEADTVSLARTSSTDSFGEPLSADRNSAKFPAFQSPWQFDVESIDELDLSDTSSEHAPGAPASPPGLRKPLRRLPLRRDFEFVRRSESVSSMGIVSHESVASEASSAASSASGVGLGRNIQQWQVNALVDSLSDDGEAGDVEDALRRLEGQINPKRQQEKASKVDDWVKTMQTRMATGDYEDEEPRFSDEEVYDDEADEDNGSNEGEDETGGLRSPSDNIDVASIASSYTDAEQFLAADSPTADAATTPIATKASHSIPCPGESSKRPPQAKPAPEDAVPLEILQSRMPNGFPSTLSSNAITTSSASSTSVNTTVPLSSKFVPHEAPRSHKSFILSYTAESLAQHFGMIDRELFISIKFEELILDDWIGRENEVDVLDWAQYLKDRARWKAEGRFPEKTSVLAAVRARFNLMANFTVSEVVLTPPMERLKVVAKFLKIAIKSYEMGSYNTVVAIVSALQSPWVKRAMKRRWDTFPHQDKRMFHDLKEWTTSDRNFMHIRRAVDTIVDAKPIEPSSHAPSIVSGGVGTTNGNAHAANGTDRASSASTKARPTHSTHSTSTAAKQADITECIPFIGVYLSQLTEYSHLPDLIDPTSPTTPVSIDFVTYSYDTLSQPEVFGALQPLPPGMQIEPLINVHKQRMRAKVIKRLVAGQHVASRVGWGVEKRLFQKCLRLRGLSDEMLGRALGMYDHSGSSGGVKADVQDWGLHI
ncbi:ras GEF [Guyanagaster necrorhizus]|uniref:Ras GEF n=1 Tax=Guyanagaster necrorhizus TaxID=856835 RepID=A0A9P7VNY0_9AGAR|nr:ras GEF [Guyanagaster necrorhizus MCA 3950]KAG7443324.1 ras GEF [Guyanagaster necrorhizus MCA 3950]